MANPGDTNFFRRMDESDDELFYAQPRMVVHIDDGAILKTGEIYRHYLPPGGAILDLMSSWRSHIPAAVSPVKLVGVGLNRAEMENNPALTEVVVHNVNRTPRLPLADASLDGAVMTVSVQYLTRPLAIFADVGRVLRPGAPFIVTFSNRMFPTKAVAIWHGAATGEQRIGIVTQYFVRSGAFERFETVDRSTDEPPSDPVWAVVGYRIAGAVAGAPPDEAA